MQCPQSWQQASVDLHSNSNMHGRGKGVVGALAAVDMVVWMNWSLGAHLPAKDFNGTIAEHLGRLKVVLLPSMLYTTDHINKES